DGRPDTHARHGRHPAAPGASSPSRAAEAGSCGAEWYARQTDRRRTAYLTETARRPRADCAEPSRQAVLLSSDGPNLLGLRALLALGDVELDLLPLLELAVAGALNRGVVHEHVRAAAVLLDEAEPLLGVEPLHGACCHWCCLFLNRC